MSVLDKAAIATIAYLSMIRPEDLTRAFRHSPGIRPSPSSGLSRAS
jgi:hypothetical protein